MLFLIFLKRFYANLSQIAPKTTKSTPVQKIDANKVQNDAGTKMHKCLVGIYSLSIVQVQIMYQSSKWEEK